MSFKDDEQNVRVDEGVSYEIPGMEEYWKQWERRDVLEAEAKLKAEAGERLGQDQPNRPSELDSWLMEKGQYNMRGYGERSDRWYDIPIDFLCKGSTRDRMNL